MGLLGTRCGTVSWSSEGQMQTLTGNFKQPEEEVALSHDSCSQQSAVSSSPERKATERTKSLL